MALAPAGMSSERSDVATIILDRPIFSLRIGAGRKKAILSMSPTNCRVQAAAVCAGVGFAMMLSGCQSVRQATGAEKTPPDEFVVPTRAPLAIPSDFTLRPPQAGMAARNETAESGGTSMQSTAAAASPAPAYSDAERLLLARTSAVPANPRAGTTMTADAGPLTQGQALAQKLLFEDSDPAVAAAAAAKAKAEAAAAAPAAKAEAAATMANGPMIASVNAPTGLDPNGYYNPYDPNGYIDRNGQYHLLRPDNPPPPSGSSGNAVAAAAAPPVSGSVYYERGRYEAACYRGEAVAGTVFPAIGGGLFGGPSRGKGGEVTRGVVLGGSFTTAISTEIGCDDQPFAFGAYAAGLNEPVGQRRVWRHGDAYGEVTVIREFRRGDLVCRDVTVLTYRMGTNAPDKGTACLTQDGEWHFD